MADRAGGRGGYGSPAARPSEVRATRPSEVRATRPSEVTATRPSEVRAVRRSEVTAARPSEIAARRTRTGTDGDARGGAARGVGAFVIVRHG
nr:MULTISPECIES: hypothetical protein [Streptomyces]